MEQDGFVKIFLDSIEVPLRLGLYPHEKCAPQPVAVTLELFTMPVPYLRNVSPDNIIDYGRYFDVITSWADRPHVQLIETYIQELLDLCFENKTVNACRVSIKKTAVFGENRGGGVEAFMHRKDWEALAMSNERRISG